MKIIPITKPSFSRSDISKICKDISHILDSGRLILGPYTKAFEKNMAKYLSKKYATAVNTCTSGIKICLSYFGVEGREVIVPSNTFVTVANSVIQCGGKLVFAEMEKRTLCLDVNDVKKKINKNTKVVIIVHMLGMITPGIEELARLCRKNRIFLIEDCSHAHGSTFKGKKVGHWGDAACLSFYPTKPMTSGLGGMILTQDENLSKYAESMRLFGADKNLDNLIYMSDDLLYGEINAAVGLQQLKTLEKNISKRNKIAKRYNELLKKVKEVKIIKVSRNCRHSYYKYAVLLRDNVDKDLIMDAMKNKYGISLSNVYKPCHLHTFYKEKFGYRDGQFPVTEQVLKQAVCLPIYAQMSAEDVNFVTKSFINEINSIK